jgi:5-oxoprolinase (ATP-hydrolysing)
MQFEFSIDRGGTFTDIYCNIYSSKSDKIPQKTLIKKLLSTDQTYGEGPREGIRQILE